MRQRVANPTQATAVPHPRPGLPQQDTGAANPRQDNVYQVILLHNRLRQAPWLNRRESCLDTLAGQISHAIIDNHYRLYDSCDRFSLYRSPQQAALNRSATVYVCVCHAVTDSQVRQAVHQGATMMRDLRQQLGVASECGRCACCARDILRTTLSELSCRDDELAEAA